VEKTVCVVHLWTRCQKRFMPLSAALFWVWRSALYVSLWRRRPLAIRWQRKALTPAPRKERHLTKQKIPWARDSLCLKWWVEVRAGVNQYPSHLTTLEGWQRWPSSSIGAAEGGVFWLAVRQWISSVLATEKDTPLSRPFAAMMEKSLRSWHMLPL